jgi:hypothetical protein
MRSRRHAAGHLYAFASRPRFCVTFDLQWQVIESVRLEPNTELSAAMNAQIQRAAEQGWHAEGGHEFGFVFIRRAGERRLLILTERDPFDTRPQSFSPFKDVASAPPTRSTGDP